MSSNATKKIPNEQWRPPTKNCNENEEIQTIQDQKESMDFSVIWTCSDLGDFMIARKAFKSPYFFVSAKKWNFWTPSMKHALNVFQNFTSTAWVLGLSDERCNCSSSSNIREIMAFTAEKYFFKFLVWPEKLDRSGKFSHPSNGVIVNKQPLLDCSSNFNFSVENSQEISVIFLEMYFCALKFYYNLLEVNFSSLESRK